MCVVSTGVAEFVVLRYGHELGCSRGVGTSTAACEVEMGRNNNGGKYESVVAVLEV